MKSYQFLLQHELINTVALHPEKTALIIENAHISYQKFLDDVLKFAAFFKNYFIYPGDRILIQSGNSYLTIISFFSAIFCEAVPCIIDEGFSTGILSSLLLSLKPKLAIVKNKNDRISSIFQEENIVCIDKIQCGKEAVMPIFHVTEQDLAMIMHTSGSTSDPKGVMLSHRNILSAVHAIRSYLGLKSNDVILSVLPLHFDYGLYQIFLSISIGATLILEENALFINKISRRILNNKATVIPCVPYFVQLLHINAKKNKTDYCSVRMITNTGENLSRTHIDKIKQLFPKAKIFSMYGLTECKRCSYVPPSILAKKTDSIGIPMPNLEMWIEDESGNLLVPGMEGNLIVSGPSVMMGYWENVPETNKKIKFTKTYKKILITGDRAIMDEDGYFYFRGRKDGMLKFKGAKLCCQSYIKSINEIRGVSRAYLFLQDDALIVCVEMEKVSDDSLKLEILSLFPSFQKPSLLYFLPQFPPLSNGKLDSRKLEMMAKEFSVGAAL